MFLLALFATSQLMQVGVSFPVEFEKKYDYKRCL